MVVRFSNLRRDSRREKVTWVLRYSFKTAQRENLACASATEQRRIIHECFLGAQELLEQVVAHFFFRG